eukprot:853766-Pyramimonas_sp.AAC.1
MSSERIWCRQSIHITSHHIHIASGMRFPSHSHHITFTSRAECISRNGADKAFTSRAECISRNSA